MNEFISIIASNALEFVCAVILAAITCLLIPLMKKSVFPFLRDVAVPWLKENRIYSIVQHFVEAAEKYAEHHDIDKKQYVVELLEGKGIDVTPEVEAYIESAVINIDLAVSGTIDIITEEETQE